MTQSRFPGAVAFLVFRTSLGLVCLWAGHEKARGQDTFAHGVAQYRILPLRFVRTAATAIVLAELGLGVLLLTGFLAAVAAAGATRFSERTRDRGLVTPPA